MHEIHLMYWDNLDHRFVQQNFVVEASLAEIEAWCEENGLTRSKYNLGSWGVLAEEPDEDSGCEFETCGPTIKIRSLEQAAVRLEHILFPKRSMWAPE